MNRILFFLFTIVILLACNNSGTTTTADSLQKVQSVDTAQHLDTASYERMPNNTQGTDSAK